jgi:ketosteroid isomerase-like protein
VAAAGDCFRVISPSDRAEILETVSRADWAATHRDADAYVALFTDDAVLDGAQGDHPGREAIHLAVGPVWAAEGPASLHLTLNAVVEAVDAGGGGATVRAILLIVAPGAPPSIVSVHEIVQTLVRGDTGWLIQRRSVAVAG